MKIGIFADIHGNVFAFENIYRELKKEKCDMHLFLGDVCGYYYHQNEVIDILKEIPHLEAVVGNHDELFLASLKDDKVMKNYTETYGRSFEFLKESITPANLEFLNRLPEKVHLARYGVAGYHGSPWSPLKEYIYPDFPMMERFEDVGFKVVFLGHTHRSMDIRLEKARVINPGSAGQPRDGGWPSYAVYDIEAGRLQIKQVEYNVDALVDEIKKRKEDNTYLVEVLHRIQTWQN